MRRRSSVRGAALLDVMFTLAALTIGAQGFARWQAAGGMTSAELAASPVVAAMTLAAPPAGDRSLPVERRR
ncbi:hypothetical protein [Pandoraea pnomenusa]|uniref:hypothetical protein n=1 Tax=Pandoraea pnomenusa TaxID=93220 RepID=UPI00333E3E40